MERSIGNAPGFDLRVIDGQDAESQFTRLLCVDGSDIEVKNDLRARETGNHAVEFEQHGRPSGIATTTASWWAVLVDDETWVVTSTRRLKEISRFYWPSRRAMGDNGNVGVLVPLLALLRGVRQSRSDAA